MGAAGANRLRGGEGETEDEGRKYNKMKKIEQKEE